MSRIHHHHHHHHQEYRAYGQERFECYENIGRDPRALPGNLNRVSLSIGTRMSRGGIARSSYNHNECCGYPTPVYVNNYYYSPNHGHSHRHEHKGFKAFFAMLGGAAALAIGYSAGKNRMNTATSENVANTGSTTGAGGTTNTENAESSQNTNASSTSGSQEKSVGFFEKLKNLFSLAKPAETLASTTTGGSQEKSGGILDSLKNLFSSSINKTTV